MSRNDIHTFLKNAGQNASLLSLDVGQKTIGVASGNCTTFTSSPLKTIKRIKFQKDMDELEVSIQEYGITGCVVGYPLNMDGSEGRACQSIRDFVTEMSKRFPKLPILLWDERLSTDSVDSYLDESVEKVVRGEVRSRGMSRRKAKAKGVTDRVAAKIILDRVLEKARQTYNA